MLRKLATVLVLVLVLMTGVVIVAGPASAHVHGITPLRTLAEQCGVTSIANTGANRAHGAPITGLVPRDVGNASLEPGDGGRFAPVGCATS